MIASFSEEGDQNDKNLFDKIISFNKVNLMGKIDKPTKNEDKIENLLEEILMKLNINYEEAENF